MSDEYYYFDLDAGVVNLNLIKKIEQNYEKKINVSLKGIQDETKNIKKV